MIQPGMALTFARLEHVVSPWFNPDDEFTRRSMFGTNLFGDPACVSFSLPREHVP